MKNLETPEKTGRVGRSAECAIILFIFYTPAEVKTYKELYNLKCQVIKKRKKRNEITTITTLLSTLVVKGVKIH